MSLTKLQLGLGAVIVAVVIGGIAQYYSQSAVPAPVEKPLPVATAPVGVQPVKAATLPPAEVTVVASPVADAKPAVAPPPPDPDAAEAARRAAQDRKVIVRRYGKLFDQLGLNADEREKLTRLLIDSREASVDYAGASAATGTDATQDPAVFAGSVAAVRQQLNDQIKALLGDDAYAQFVAGDEAIKQTAVIDRAQKALKGTGVQLTAAQADQLQGVLQDLGVHYVNDDVLARASSFLTPQQMAVLQQQQAQRAKGAGKERVQEAVNKNRP